MVLKLVYIRIGGGLIKIHVAPHPPMPDSRTGTEEIYISSKFPGDPNVAHRI